jgi:cation-transporting ATPase E
VPCGFIAAAATFGTYAFARNVQHVSLSEARTTATLVLMVVGLYVLSIHARPITPFRAVLVAAMVGLFVVALSWPAAREFFALNVPETDALIGGVVMAGIAVAVLEAGWMYVQHQVPRQDRVRRLAWRNPHAMAITASRDA